MEQVIKFRGKRIDNNEWVYGCCGYGFTQKIEYIMPSMYFATRDFGEQDDRGNPIIDDEIAIGGFIPVIPESVGQFTGLTDKHGKEIYCGDILKGVSYNTFSKGQSDNYEVIWGVDGWHIKGTYFSIQELRNYCNNDIEIIGNIHQNIK